MCIPKEEPCPINDVVIGSASELKLYSDKGYKTGFLENMTEDQILFYTNETVQNQIVVKLNITNETLRYIHEGNLIFDNDTYDDYVAMYSGGGDGYSGSDWGGGWDSGGGDWGGGGIDSGGGGFRRLEDEEEEDSIYGSPSITKYIRERFNDEINIDKTFRNISDNLFAGNTPSGPLSKDTSPINILPFKYVPVATIIELTLYIAPTFVSNEHTLLFLIARFTSCTRGT